MQDIFRALADRPSQDNPRRLTGNCSPRIHRAWWFWLVLFLLCALPRIILACQIQAYCNDSYLYIYLADHVVEGNWTPLFEHFGINIYPLILIAGHWLGLTWTGAGVAWGVLVGSLTVLPLYGWLRRIGNDQVALAGSVLYASQPKFIELSFEPIRDTTYWFFFALCLYFTWRAIEKLNLRWFLAAGLCLALAVHTRTEGWLLLIPISAWLLFRAFEEKSQRLRTAVGSLALFAMVPLFVVLVNLSLLRGEPEWQMGKLRHVATTWSWVFHKTPDTALATSSVERSQSVTESKPAAASGPQPPSTTLGFRKQSYKYFHDLHSTLEPIHCLLIALGLYSWRHVAWQIRFFPIILLAALTGIAIWLLISMYGLSNGRYFLTAYLALLPIESLGLLSALHWIREHRNALSRTESSGVRWAMSAILLVLMVGWIDAFTFRDKMRKDEIALVEWLKHSPYSTTDIAVDRSAMRIGYHLHDDMPPVMGSPWDLPSFSLHSPPQVVIVSKSRLAPGQFAEFQRQVANWNYRVIETPVSGQHCVLVHSQCRECQEDVPATLDQFAADTGRLQKR